MATGILVIAHVLSPEPCAILTADLMPLSGGTRLGPYELISLLGTGGMGEVYRAHDSRLQRDVAIKVSATEFSDRFEREARMIAALNHPHICTIYDVGPNYLVMELVEGAALNGPLPTEEAIRYAVQICDALDAAHKKGITHRDLKPGNILVTASGVKLLDFGLARSEPTSTAADKAPTVALTTAGVVIGTPAYMSPEQARGEPLDARSDVFSFGAVLYQMLSGRPAFARDSTAEILSAILRDEPRPLDAPPDVAAVVTRCLRKHKEDRFQTIAEVRAALGAASVNRSPSHKSSIAVLPFANLSADKDNEYFGDGLAEEILNLLAKIPGLKVIARTSSFAFRGKEQDVTTIAGALRVDHILEGSVRRAGNRVRVTAQLIQAADGAHLWSERYDRDLTDIFAIQDEIGASISESLKVRLAPPVPVVNIDAWQHCLKGEYYRLSLTPEGLAKAKEHFDQAIAIDPTYALAYARLGAYYYGLSIVDMSRLKEVGRLAREAAQKALALDPASSGSHSLMGALAAALDNDWHAAEHHHQHAMAGDNAPPHARYVYAIYYLLPLGRVADAVEQSQLALQSDPLSMLLNFGVAFAMYCDKRYEESIACARRALEIEHHSYYVWDVLGQAQLALGRYEEATATLARGAELAPWYSSTAGALACAYYLAGDRARARECADRLARLHGATVGVARYLATTGEVDAMFDALEGAYEQRDLFLLWLRNWTSFDPYRDDPRFRSLLERMRLVDDNRNR